MKKNYALLLLLLMTTTSFGQGQNDACSSPAIADGHWYFGRKNGLDFSSGVPVYDNAADIHNRFTSSLQEASAIQSDQHGNLLFYHDGYALYDQNHVQLANNLGGHASSAGGSIIVPDPGQQNRYYLFVTGVTNSNVIPVNSVFSYTLVDINGTQASVNPATTFVTIDAPSGYMTDINNGLHCSEGVTAIAGCGNVYWIIATGRKSSNDHYLVVYKLDSSGITFHSEKSIPGILSTSVQGDYAIPIEAAPNGKKIAINPFRDGNVCRVFDFDNATGIISNEKIINRTSIYGLCFSPNSQLLYASEVTTDNLYQYNLQVPNPGLSEVQVGPFNNLSGLSYDLERGPDDKIYISRRTANLAVIHNPNTLVTTSNTNACNLDDNGPSLLYYCDAGLPNVFDADKAHVFPSTNISGARKTCVSYTNPENYSVSLNPGETVSWSVNGGAFTSANNLPNIAVDWNSLPGTLTVQVSDATGCQSSQTISVIECCDVSPCDCSLIPAMSYTPGVRGCEYTFSEINYNDPACATQTQYVWNFGDGSANTFGKNVTHTFPQAGTYTVCLTVLVYDENGFNPCEQQICEEVVISCGNDCECELNPSFDIQLKEDECAYTFGGFHGGPECLENVEYNWTFGDGTSATEQYPTHIYTQPGVYLVCLDVIVYDQNNKPICKKKVCKEVEVKCAGHCDCKLKPEFDIVFDEKTCTYYFEGLHGGPNCLQNVEYIWHFGDGTTSIGQNAGHTYANTGGHEVCLDVIVRNEKGEVICSEKTCQELEVRCKRDCDCKLEPDFEVTYLSSCELLLTAFSGSDCANIKDIVWVVNGNQVWNGSTFQFTMDVNITYDICMEVDAYTSTGECKDKYCETFYTTDCYPGFKSGAVITTTTGAAALGVNLFPNPTQDEVSIQFNQPVDSEVRVALKSVDGKILSSEVMAADRLDGLFVVSIPSSVPDGFVIVEIQTRDKVFVERVMIMKK